MNIKYLLSLLLTASFSCSLQAQYGGGQDDGFACEKTIAKSTLAGESLSAMYGGGQDDGFACRKTIAKSTLAGESLSSLYGGGQDDGFACKKTIAKSTLAGESLTGLYGGGLNDGFSCENLSAQSTISGVSMEQLYGGGQNDGFACDKLEARTSLTGESMSQLFGGGQDDGFGCDKLDARTALSGESMSQLFGGGQNDGFACDGSAGVPITPLSLSLVHFDAIAQPSTVLLHWVTVQEHNNDYFTLERSLDGTIFETIGSIPSQGDSHYEQSYEFLDGDPLEGVSWYRLTWTDLDGLSATSELKMVLFERGETVSFTIFPNPLTGNQLNVRFSIPTAGETWEIRLLDIHGRTVFADTRPRLALGETAQFELPTAMASGSYLIQIHTEKRVLTRRLLILGE